MKSKLLPIFFISIFILSFILLFKLHDSTKNEVIDRFQTQQLFTTKQLIKELKTYLQNQSQSIEKLSSLTLFKKNTNINQTAAVVQEYFENMKKDHIQSISVYNEDGTIIYSTLKEAVSLKQNETQFYKWSKLKENRGEQFISTEIPSIFLRNSKDSAFLTFISSPIYSETNSLPFDSKNERNGKSAGSYVGLVVAVVDLSDILTSFFQNDSAHKDKRSTWLLDKDGTLLYHPEHPEMIMFTMQQQDKSCFECHTSFKYVETILAKSSGTTEYQLKDNPQKLSSFASLNYKNISWKVVTNIPLDEVSNFVDNNLIQTMLLFGVIVFTLIGTTFSISRSNRLKIKAEEDVKHWKEKHELEIRLRESEHQYKTIVENSPNSIFIHSEGKIVYVNPAGMAMYGVTDSAKILGMPVFDLVHPDDRRTVQERIKKMLETGGPAPLIEERFYRRDKSVFIADVAPMPITYQNKPAVQVIVMDITERKRGELERQVLHEMTQGVTTTSNLDELLKLIHGSLKKVIYAENCFVALHDKNTELFTFPYFVDKFDPTPEPTTMRKSCSAYVFRTCTPLLLTPELFNRLEEQKEVETTGSPAASWIGVPLQTPSHVIGVLVLQHYEEKNIYQQRDLELLQSIGSQIALVIERKRSEEALRESEEQHRLIFETAQEGLFVAQKNKFRYFNPMVIEITGYTAEELTAISLDELIYADDKELVLTNYQKRLAGETAKQRYHFRIIRKDKTIRWVELSGAKLAWKGEVATLNFINDITEQKQAELELVKLNDELQLSRELLEKNLIQKNITVEELTVTKEKLEKLNAEKDKFFSIIAHDLRSPFNGFLGLTEMMATGSEDFSKIELTEYSKSLHEAASNLFKLIENLLEWAQMQKGSIEFAPQVLDLSRMVAQCSDTINHRALQKGITLINEVSKNEKVYADEKMLDAILRNFLSNAVKFTRREGKVVVKAKQVNSEMVEVSVSDTGIGMSEKNVKKLFKMEEKVSSRGTEGEPSTGLGLLLCKEFVEKQGGKIWVESMQNVGSTFFFTLPLNNIKS